MDALAHGLWAAAAATAAQRTGVKLRVLPFALWATFPDVLAFGPSVAAGLVLLAVRGRSVLRPGYHGPHLHLGISLYAVGHSLIVFGAVFGLCALIARRPVLPLLGWLMHILIDIPTHSSSYYATRFLWPLTDYGFEGVAWWTPWLLWSTYGGLALVYLLLWRAGWFRLTGRSATPHNPQPPTKRAEAPGR